MFYKCFNESLKSMLFIFLNKIVAIFVLFKCVLTEKCDIKAL